MLKCMKIALWQFKSWKGSARVIVVLLLAIVTTVYQSLVYIDYVDSLNESINIFETYIMVMNNRWHIILMYICGMILFADAPFMNNNSLYVVSRVGRYSWALGMSIYIVVASIIYSLIILLTTIICSASYSYGGDIWSRPMVSLLDGSAWIKGAPTMFTNYNMAYNYTPMETALLGLGLFILLISMLGMMLFALNIVNGKVLGFAVASITYFVGFLISEDNMVKFFPFHNSILDYHETGSRLCDIPIMWSFIYFGGLIVVWLVIALFMIRKVDYKITVGERV